MFSGLQENQLKGALEAMLFVTDEPISIIVLAEMLEIAPAQVQQSLEELAHDLEQADRGIQLREIAGGWRLFTHPVYHELLEQYVLSWDTRKLSQAAIETLAIVAYSQPVTRATVSAIRGVSSDSSLNSLVEKGLVREAGTDEESGNATLYATTKTFLEKFGLRNVSDLPPLETYAPDDETREFIRERLSATRRTEALEMIADEEGEYPDLDMDLELDGDDLGTEMSDAQPMIPSDLAQEMLAEAMASSLGAVEKIDLDSLNFELNDDDE